MKRVKVVRTCPRCRVRAYQWGNDMGIPHRIRCANCAHCWAGRILRDECEDIGKQNAAPGVEASGYQVIGTNTPTDERAKD